MLRLLSVLAAALLTLPAAVAHDVAAPTLDAREPGASRGMWSVAWMWDRDGDSIDDRLPSAGAEPVTLST